MVTFRLQHTQKHVLVLLKHRAGPYLRVFIQDVWSKTGNLHFQQAPRQAEAKGLERKDSPDTTSFTGLSSSCPSSCHFPKHPTFQPQASTCSPNFPHRIPLPTDCLCSAWSHLRSLYVCLPENRRHLPLPWTPAGAFPELP